MSAFDFTFDEFAAAALAGWERRVQETYISPRIEEPDDPLGEAMEFKPSPRPNIVISRVPGARAPEAACAEFIEQTRSAVPGFKIVAEQFDFPFDDGTSGVALEVEFPASDTIYLVQQHVFRSDDEVETQLVSTIAKGQETYRETLLKVIRGFQPQRDDATRSAE